MVTTQKDLNMQKSLDKNFMLFILNLFNGAEFDLIKTYNYLDDLLGDEEEFDDIDDVILPNSLAVDIQCKFRGIFTSVNNREGAPVESNYGLKVDHFSLPCKRDLLYMKMLQDKFAGFLRIELDSLTKTLISGVKQKTQEEIDRDTIRYFKKCQKANNIKRESEGEPKVTLAEYIVTKEGGQPDIAKAVKETSRWLKQYGEDPDQIN